MSGRPGSTRKARWGDRHPRHHGRGRAQCADVRARVPHLNAHLAGAAVVAHHARFDLAFLRSEYARAGWELPYVPAPRSLEASDYHLPHLDRRRLAD